MFDLNFPIAFAAGLASFFAPCAVPLLPAYIGYVSGVSLKELKDKGFASYRKKLILTSLLYILGFSIVFVVLGTTVASIGMMLRRYDHLIQRLGGLLILVFGLEFAGIIKLPFLNKQKQFTLPNWTGRLGYARSFVVGLIFAIAWTPCIGAVLGSILTLAAISQTAIRGASLLFVYSLGISVPFLLVSLTLASAPKYLKVINKHLGTISKAAGLILVLLGLLLITDTYKFLNSWLFKIAFELGYEIR